MNVLMISDRRSVHRLGPGLAAAGFDVSHCSGPQPPEGRCDHGSPCAILAWADAVVLDTDLADEHGSGSPLVQWSLCRSRHLPVVLLIGAEETPGWVVDLGTAVLRRSASGDDVAAALRRLLAGRRRDEVARATGS